MKPRFSVVLLIILGSTLLLFTGCLPLLTLFGFRVVGIEDYTSEIEIELNAWADVVADWEEAANESKGALSRHDDAHQSYSRMADIISEWNNIDPPPKFAYFHNSMREAMQYDKQAFEVMAEYYLLNTTFEPDEEELNLLHEQAIELWRLKDEALNEALQAYPPK